MAVINIGSVGVGAISKHVHLPGIQRSPDLNLTAICDIDHAALKEVGDRYGIPENRRFSDYRDLIHCPDVDAVDISTSNDAHYKIALAAAKAGKPYSVEKPLSLTSEEADHLAQVTEEMAVKSMVCFSYRFKAAARFARSLVQRGMLGEIYHADMQYYQAWGLPFFHTPLKWRFVKERTGSGALGDLGSHALDLVRFVTGKEYLKVVSHTGTYIHERAKEDGSGMGKVDVDDFANYMAELEGGAAATFRITRFGYGRGNYQTLELYGSEGALVYDLDRAAPDVDTLEVCIGRVNAENHVFSKLPIPREFYADQMQSFADLINGKGDSLSANIQDGKMNQHAMDAVIKSAETGLWQTV